MANIFYANSVRMDEKVVRRLIRILDVCDLNAYPYVPQKCGQAALDIYQRLQGKGWANGWECYVSHPTRDDWMAPDANGIFAYHAWLSHKHLVVELLTSTTERGGLRCELTISPQPCGVGSDEIVERLSPVKFKAFVDTLKSWRAAS